MHLNQIDCTQAELNFKTCYWTFNWLETHDDGEQSSKLTKTLEKTQVTAVRNDDVIFSMRTTKNEGVLHVQLKGQNTEGAPVIYG